MKINTTSSFGIFPDTRTVQNSGVGLTELPPREIAPHIHAVATNTTPNASIAGVGVTMIQGFPGAPRSVKLDSNWLNNPGYGQR